MNPMNQNHDRRLFLQAGTAIAANSVFRISARAEENTESTPNEKISIGIMGANNRGAAIAKGMMDTGEVEIAYICDVDDQVSSARQRSDHQGAIAPTKGGHRLSADSGRPKC